MTRWPLLLPPPAVSTSPSHSLRSSSSIIIKSPSHRSSPSSCRRAVHRRSAAPSITVKLPSHCPSPPIAVVLSVHRRRARGVPCRGGAITRRPSPSWGAVEELSRRTSPSRSRLPCRLTTPATRLALPSLSSGWLPRCLSSHRRLPSAGALHCGHHLSCLSSIRLVVPSPRFSRHHLPSACPSKPLVWLVVALPLLTPPPPICRCPSLRPSPFVPLVHPAGCSVSSLLTPPPPICRCLCLSSRRRLLSRPSQASCPAG
jgi:hypothetical protein